MQGKFAHWFSVPPFDLEREDDKDDPMFQAYLVNPLVGSGTHPR